MPSETDRCGIFVSIEAGNFSFILFILFILSKRQVDLRTVGNMIDQDPHQPIAMRRMSCKLRLSVRNHASAKSSLAHCPFRKTRGD